MEHGRGRGQTASGRGSRQWAGSQTRSHNATKSTAPTPAAQFPTAASLFSKTFPPPRATAPATKLGKWNLPYPSIDLFSSLYHPAMEDAGTDASGGVCARPVSDASHDPLAPEEDGPHPNARLLSSAFGPYNLPATAALSRPRMMRVPPSSNELLPNLDDVLEWAVGIDGSCPQVNSASQAVYTVMHSNLGVNAAPICTCGSGLAAVSLGVHGGVAAAPCAVHRDHAANIIKERPPRRPRRMPRVPPPPSPEALAAKSEDMKDDGPLRCYGLGDELCDGV